MMSPSIPHQTQAMNTGSIRRTSIDVFRALTMFFMIFVNDVDGVKNIPQWIKHVTISESGLGFADVIFPAFLFIVGLSLPLSLQRKKLQGATDLDLLKYISIRAFALIVMGLFQVNFSYYNSELVGVSKSWYIIFCTISFFLVWMDYPKTLSKKWKNSLEFLGWFLLGLLAAIYRSGSNNQVGWMEVHWWGILGLIGWSYWFVGLGFVFTKARFAPLLTFFIVLIALNFAVHLGWLTLPAIVVGDSAHAVLVAGGVLATLYYSQKKQLTISQFTTHFILAGAAFFVLGSIAAQWIDGINKIRATPGWVHLCMGISLWCYAACIFFIDYKKRENVFKWIAAAGTNTLTCYLLPYIWYAMMRLFGFSWPAMLNEGAGGIVRSFLVAYIIVQIAAWLGRRSIRIKV